MFHAAKTGSDMAAAAEGRRDAGHYASYLTLLLVLILCALRGHWTITGLDRPTDLDSFRDIGYVQALLDGNLFGDPMYGGEPRFYSPLMHAIAAAAAWLTGLSPMVLWVKAAPWFNLLAPLAFFDMNRRLFNVQVAAVATAIFALNGLLIPPWVAAGYSPWPIICNLALPLFFVGVSLIFEYARYGRAQHGAAIGVICGLAFLTHPFPAILLTVIAGVAAFVERGASHKTAAWLVTLGTVEFLLALAVLGPLLVRYRLTTLNPAPAFWTDPMFDTRIAFLDTTIMTLAQKLSVLAVDLMGVAVLVTAAILLWRGRLPAIERRTRAILAAWIGLCVLLLSRHYICAIAGGEGAGCRIPIVPVHHYHFYLQAVWASIGGWAVWSGFQLLRSRGLALPMPSRIRPVLLVIASAAAAGAVLLFDDIFVRTYDFRARAWALNNGDNFDAEAYRWILKNTDPADLFVTEKGDLDVPWNDRSFTVMAAGRRLVAVPATFSNPYVDPNQRERRRTKYLSALSQPSADLCDLEKEAGKGRTAWFLLREGTPAEGANVKLALKTGLSSIYSLRATCLDLASLRPPHVGSARHLEPRT
jgi:hypothetical protein